MLMKRRFRTDRLFCCLLPVAYCLITKKYYPSNIIILFIFAAANSKFTPQFKVSSKIKKYERRNAEFETLKGFLLFQ